MNFAQMRADSRFRQVRLKTRPSLLPATSHYRAYAREYDPWVLLHEGDLTLESLQLDFGDEADNDERNFACVVVNGSLEVKTWVCNDDEDGALGLFVRHDMSAANVVTGGQELFVAGDLDVAEVLWGTYNHGEYKVGGVLRAGLVIQDDFHVDAAGGVVAARRLREFDHAELRAWLHAEALFDAPDVANGGGDDFVLYRGGAIARLAAGHSILRRRLSGRRLALSRELTASSVLALINAVSPRARCRTLQIEDTHCVLTRHEGCVTIELNQNDQRTVVLGASSEGEFEAVYVDYRSREPSPQKLDAKSPRSFRDFLAAAWPILVSAVERRALASKADLLALRTELEREVTLEKIMRIVGLPMVTEKYRSSLVDTDDSGYWHGERLFAFNVETDEHTPSVDVMEEVSPDLRPLFPRTRRSEAVELSGYRFGINEAANGKRSVEFAYCPHTESEWGDLDLDSCEHLSAALAAWHTMWLSVFDDNERYLRGESLDDRADPVD